MNSNLKRANSHKDQGKRAQGIIGMNISRIKKRINRLIYLILRPTSNQKTKNKQVNLAVNQLENYL